MPLDLWTSLGMTFGGGICINIIRYFEITTMPKSDRPPLDKIYVAQFIMLPLVSCFLVYAYILDGTQLTAFSALSLGVSGPLVFKQLSSTIPKTGADRTN
jgi:hypothetical protein